MFNGLTSNPRFERSCSTAQDASKSRPLMFMDPNFMEVEGLDGAWRVVGALAWRDFLNCLVCFCLCFFGLYVRRSINLVVLFLVF